MADDTEKIAAENAAELTINNVLEGLKPKTIEFSAVAASPELDPNSPDFNAERYLKLNDMNNAAARAAIAQIKEMLGAEHPKYTRAVNNALEIQLMLQAARKGRILAEKEDENGVICLTDYTDKLKALADEAQERAKTLTAWAGLVPFIQTELQKPENAEKYAGKDFNEILLDSFDAENKLIPGSLFDIALTAAQEEQNKRNIIKAQQAGRDARREMNKKAKEQNAIMEIRGDVYPVPSLQELWDAFAPKNICEIGTLDKSYIDEKTGFVRKSSFSPGEIIPLERLDAPLQAMMLLSTIVANSTQNYFEDFIQAGEIRFSVQKIMQETFPKSHALPLRDIDNEQITFDHRTLDRKTEAVIFLENLFKPLLNYVGKLPNGSRYSVYNYVGYDITSDTMIIRTPYICEMWKQTQAEYFDRKARLQTAIDTGKRPNKEDFAPLKVNALIKSKAMREDEITLAIMVYITNLMLAAGAPGKGNTKKINVSFNTVIKEIAQLEYRINEINNNADRYPNPAAIINSELRKFERAKRFVLDPKYCAATEKYEIVKFARKEKDSNKIVDFKAPTKSTLHDEIYIEWEAKKNNDGK